MRNKLMVVTDLGCLKAYRVLFDGVSSTPQLELVDSFETLGSHEKLANRVTDEAGRFGGANPTVKGVAGSGERHNMYLEEARRSIKELASSINELVKREKEIQDCYFAASKEINHQILSQLEPSVRSRIVKIISEDLTRIAKEELLQHFPEPERRLGV